MDRSTLKRPAITPPLEIRLGESHYFTPIRAKVRGAVQFCEKMWIQYSKEDVFRTFDVSSRQEWEFLRDNAPSRRRHNDPSNEETRGRKSVGSPEKPREMERILETEGLKHEHIHGSSWGVRLDLNALAVQSQRQRGLKNTTSVLLVKGLISFFVLYSIICQTLQQGLLCGYCSRTLRTQSLLII